ncbi:MAG: TerC family protein [Betaproteobacteria bacterium]|nr:MAG: TerC family protein [Betaproteobacteria bacterium]
MSEWLTPQFLIAVAQIIMVNILLSGDNAVVIALACRNLSRRQRRLGILWGVLGAIGLRLILTFFAMSLLVNPYLKLIGGALLLWIGVKLIAEEEGGEHSVKASDRLLSAIWTIIVADLVMSLDNVMAVAAAAKGNVPLIVFGLVISIPIVVFGSQLIMRIIGRFPVLVWAGGGLLGYIAGDMAIEDPAIAPWIAANISYATVFAPAAGFVLVVVTGVWLSRRRARLKKA